MGKHGSVASCAVCMDPLFHQLDDVDEEVPVVITECGHAYHNPCILEWCKSQEERGLALLRDQLDDEDEPPTVDEVQVVCPTCREECYRDVSTKKMMFTRLYLNFSEDMPDFSGVFSQTPVKAGLGGRSEELMRLARTAKRLTQDVKEVDGDVKQATIDGMTDKAAGLCRDGASVKSIKAVQTHLTGLTNAMNNMTATLRAHPLAATLQIELEATQARVKEAQREVRYQREVALPRALEEARRKTRETEEARASKIHKQLSAALAKIQSEQTQRMARSKEADEREAHMRAEIGSLQKQLGRAEEARESISKELFDRKRQLKEHQAKAVSRKELQARIKELEADNLALRSGISGPRSTRGESSGEVDRKTTRRPIIGSSTSSLTWCDVSTAKDESLQIDLPSFSDGQSKQDPFESSPSYATSPKAAAVRTHPTSRTFSYDALTSMSDIASTRKRKSSKYWPDDAGNRAPRPGESSSPQAADQSDVIIAPSSPVRPPTAKKSRTNPYEAPKRDGKDRHRLKSGKEIEQIDLCSTDGDSPLRQTNTNVTQTRRLTSNGSAQLRLTDRNGRPTKGLATGSKTRVRH